MKNSKDYVILNNGVKMPSLGFGTYNAKNLAKLNDSIKESIKIGYRHIDTASFYGNEEVIGGAIEESDVCRDEIFLVDKVWNSEQGYEKTLNAFKNSIKKLKTDYLDLYLIHWPQSLNKETWKALEKLYKDGYVRAIGVSNFTINHLKNLIENGEIMPSVNQIEFHPRLVQKDLIEFCKKYDIQLEAWSPLMRGGVFQILLLQEVAKKYQRTISQIVLKWDLQMGFSTIPKSTTSARIKENSEIFNFEISKEDMIEIEKLNDGFRIGMDPNEVYERPEIILE
ncbi:diketogulonate reductase-like aldo/keto reductase [Clostridium beijerinckii]|nr:aldo/keto reductase [Clostridium beijerinckii]MBA8933774.1 diketogulonate reductase-like aldo/keto reductase [Clostridium beijerinckii]NRU37970.1 diketogulonate reductase-like aldo/keto reductase [Clostridium beijerinckii]NSA98751.1 diketogulonate reductase-like aldo/keto reductase [Clostridium beijerinckii]OOM61551.1 glyoxal reductase [Clostridium beijerinckii]OOM68074.1 glyoxal reductase [Clostridium beijerinckii]